MFSFYRLRLLLNRIYAPKPRNLPALAAALLMSSFAFTSHADHNDDGETLNKVQSAYVYQFTKFIQWPAEAFGKADAPFRICLLTGTNKRTYYEPLKQRVSAGHPIEILNDPDQSNLLQCHILVLGDQTQSTLKSMLAHTANHPVLTISDAENFIEQGGMIGFVVEEGKVRLAVNVHAIKSSGLEVSAKLLEVAKYVQNTGEKNR